ATVRGFARRVNPATPRGFQGSSNPHPRPKACQAAISPARSPATAHAAVHWAEGGQWPGSRAVRMTRLNAYLVRLFASDAAALFGVGLFLLFLIQCLRSFDVVSVKGQDLLTLAGQALLIMPTMAVVFLYISAAIGLGRGLRTLQASQELHISHVSQRSSVLIGAIALFIVCGMTAVLLLSNFVKPATQRQYSEWSASVAADVVGRALTSNRFTEVVPGVTIAIGGREAGGEL